MDKLKIYTGYDKREAVGYHTFCASVIERATKPVSFTPLHIDTLNFYKGGERDGTNAFAFSRFLIPYMERYNGWALFVDGADMICRTDITTIMDEVDLYNAVSVVKNVYESKHPRKYVGTLMEAENRPYERKNWSSVMVINCAHFAWRSITPDTVATMRGLDLHQFRFIPDQRIGSLSPEWNWLADEYGPNDNAKIVHWTAGIPGFPHYKDAPMSEVWRAEHARANHATE
jgi:hypothetical protein